MKVFISYRREDSQDIAARIAERLNAVPGIKNVFIDVAGINPGEEFPRKITSAIEESDACLILIGKHWTGSDPLRGSSRLMNPEDFVHREVAASLASKARTIPVLLNGASMPSTDRLPEDIKQLPSLNALFVRHASFDQDMQWLDDVLFLRPPRSGLVRFFRRHPFLLVLAKALRGLAIMGALLLLLAVAHYELTGGQALEQTLGSQGNVWLVVITFLLLGIIASILLSRRP